MMNSRSKSNQLFIFNGRKLRSTYTSEAVPDSMRLDVPIRMNWKETYLILMVKKDG